MHKLKSNHISLKPNQRLYGTAKPLIALTGGIATGKSSAAHFIKKMGVPLIDADLLIHQIYELPESIEFVQKLCPAAVSNQKIDFKILRKEFFSEPKLKQSLEDYLYRKLPDQFESAYNSFSNSSFEYVIYDIPLLFEKELKSKFDGVILIYSPRATQLERLMKRDQISKSEAENILSHQLDIEEKRKMADFVIENTKDLEHLENSIIKLFQSISDE